jgi:hypothetical protein
MRVLADVAQARHHAVAPVLGVGEGRRVDHVQEAGCARAKAVVAFAVCVGGGDERELLAADKVDHGGVEVVENLVVVESCRTPGGAVLDLKVSFSGTSCLAHPHSRLVIVSAATPYGSDAAIPCCGNWKAPLLGHPCCYPECEWRGVKSGEVVRE